MADQTINFKCLLSLLDDPDEAAVVRVFAKLLAHGDELLERDELKDCIENSSGLMQKRITLLVNALEQRQRRQDFLLRADDPEVDFFDLLVDLHLLWFDTDTEESVRETMESVLECVRQNTFNDLETISHWMIGSGMKAEQDTTIIPELYCAGSVFNSYRGAASLLTAATFNFLPRNSGICSGQVLNDFALRDASGNTLIPVRNWQIFSAAELPVFTPWSDREIIKLAAANLLSSAVNSDSLRYILTIGQALSGWSARDTMLALPYPYNGSANTL